MIADTADVGAPERRREDRARERIVVIGGGIAGLTAAYRLTQRLPDAEIVLLEAAPRLGGKIVTERVDGFVIEGGPEAILASKPEGMALCQELGLADWLIETNPASRRTFIVRDGRLRPLPEGLSGMIPTQLGPIARSRLISPRGKLRMALDLALPRRRSVADESLAGFVERRLGREAYRWLVDPLIGGIYAGDGHALSLAATFPQWQALEREHGSLIRGALAARQRAPAPPGGAPRSPFRTLPGGLSELTAALAERLRAAGVRIETSMPVTALSRSAAGYAVVCASGASSRADAVVCAIPAPAAAAMLAGLDPALAASIDAIPYASVATIALAYPRQAIPRPLDGSGYVTPRAEGRAVKACTWVSAKWAGRAPTDAALFRVSLGGAGREAILDASDDHLIGIARDELRSMLGIEAPPNLTRLFRWPQAMPQYAVGHLEQVAAINAVVAERHPGLSLAGNAYQGVGLPDCIRSGEQAADCIHAWVLDEGSRFRV